MFDSFEFKSKQEYKEDVRNFQWILATKKNLPDLNVNTIPLK
jgi:hypothetical protein